MPNAAADIAADPLEDELGPLQPIGPDCGELLLELLELNGWTVHRRPAFAGDGVLLIATHPDGYDIRADGPTTAAAATPLFWQAARIRPVDGDEQLAIEP